jgi:hypothetical protein
MKHVGLLFLAFALGGCVVGTKAVYTPAKVTLDYAGQGPVSVGVKDSRPEVVGGDRKESFVGLQRSLYGIPYAVQTQSGKSLAQELAEMVSRGLQARQVEVEQVPLSPFVSRDQAITALEATSNPRLLLFEVNEWYGDTYSRTTLHYQVELSVLDAEGRELGRASVAGEDEIGGKQRAERRTVQAATANIVQTLLASRDIVAAVSPDARPRAAGGKCSVEQVLKMKEAGLSEAQIKAACGEE